MSVHGTAFYKKNMAAHPHFAKEAKKMPEKCFMDK